MAELLPADEAFIRKLTEIVLQNLANENFGVEDLARESGVSAYTLNRRMHSINQKTVSQFIREVRLQKAHEMLRNEALTAAEVSYKVGFSSPAYFNTCFHEYFGYPPGKVRQVETLKADDKVGSKVHEKKKSFSSWIWISGLVMTGAIVYLAVVFIPGLSFGKNKSTGTPVKSIVILPFRNLSDSIADQYYIDGVTDEIIINLSRLHGFRIVSETSTEQFRDSRLSIPEIARRLHVNYVVEGSGQKYGSTFRLRVQLIEAATDRHLWAKWYEQVIKGTEDIFNIQSEVARTIASELNATITLEEQNRMERIPTTNLAALELYMKAGGYYRNYQKTKSLTSYTKAVTNYKAALDLDSTFARAYSDLANVYLRRYFWETYFREDFLDTCLVLANMALSFDPRLEDAWQLIGRCCFEKGDIDGALRNYDKAIELNPEYSDALAYKGYLLTSLVGDYVGGIDAYQKAVRTGPPEYTPGLLRGLGQAFLDVGIIDSTRSCYLRAYEFDGNKGLYLYNQSDIAFCLENFNEALRLGYEAFRVDSAFYPENSYFYGDTGRVAEAFLQAKKLIRQFEKSGELNLDQAHRIGYAFWRAGKHDEAKKYFDMQINYSREIIKLNRMISQFKLAHYDLAGTYAFLGDSPTAYKYLEEFDRKSFYPLWWVTLAKHDPLFNNIRNDEKFNQILRNMQVKFQAEHDRVEKWLKGAE